MAEKRGIDAGNDLIALYLESLRNPQPEDLRILSELRKGTEPERVIPKKFLLMLTNETTDGGG